MPAGADTKFVLKRLSSDGVATALKKAERYRLLNEPRQAESICRDVLEVEPGNNRALAMLLLSLTDQFPQGRRGCLEEARALLATLPGEYEKAYYAGIISERQGKALLERNTPSSGAVAYSWLVEAMESYEQAGRVRPQGNDAALLRWNTCARMIMDDERVRPEAGAGSQAMLE
jgi:hypothetical protein